MYNKRIYFFFVFVIYNGFVICQLYTIDIAGYNASKYFFYYIKTT